MELEMLVVLLVLAAMCVVIKVAAVRLRQQRVLNVATTLRGCQGAQKGLKEVLTEEHRIASQEQRLAREHTRLLAQLGQLRARTNELERDLGAAAAVQSRRLKSGAVVR